MGVAYRMCLYTSLFTTRNQEIKTLERIDQAIKQASRKNQTIKHSFWRSKFLIAVADESIGHRVVTTPC
jgi:hypothetical protein